jgi:hypothetical protein
VALKNKVHRISFKRAFWGAMSRLIGVSLASGVGPLVHSQLGGGFNGWGMALFIAALSFLFMLYAEYHRIVD